MTVPPAKPAWLKPLPQNIPEALRAFPQWVCWRGVWVEGTNGKPGRWTKVPYQPNGQKASVTNQAHWTDFSEAVASCEDCESDFDGFGFVLTENDPFVGIDLDKCIDADGVIAIPVQAIIKAMNSYSEYSPSGTGIRIFVRGQLAKAIKQGKAEVYGAARYLTCTGWALKEVAV